MKILKTILAFITAVVVAHVLTSIMGTQFVLADIQGYGLAVSLSDRMAATLHDIIGVVPVMLILVAASFLIAFLVAALGFRFVKGRRQYWYLAAGFTSLPVTMVLMKSTMGITPFAAAGTVFGLFLIALCGLVGAWVYLRLTQEREA